MTISLEDAPVSHDGGVVLHVHVERAVERRRKRAAELHLVGRELDRDATLETTEHGRIEVRDTPVEDLTLILEGLEGLAHLVRIHEHVWTVK